MIFICAAWLQRVSGQCNAQALMPLVHASSQDPYPGLEAEENGMMTSLGGSVCATRFALSASRYTISCLDLMNDKEHHANGDCPLGRIVLSIPQWSVCPDIRSGADYFVLLTRFGNY